LDNETEGRASYYCLEYVDIKSEAFYQINPVALAHLGERQTEVQSLNLEVLCSIHRSDTSFGAWQVQDSSILFASRLSITKLSFIGSSIFAHETTLLWLP
jgi:hypothetical protein